jgi:hypothetical protein
MKIKEEINTYVLGCKFVGEMVQVQWWSQGISHSFLKIIINVWIDFLIKMCKKATGFSLSYIICARNISPHFANNADRYYLSLCTICLQDTCKSTSSDIKTDCTIFAFSQVTITCLRTYMKVYYCNPNISRMHSIFSFPANISQLEIYCLKFDWGVASNCSRHSSTIISVAVNSKFKD